jgi:hypothetical protein
VKQRITIISNDSSDQYDKLSALHNTMRLTIVLACFGSIAKPKITTTRYRTQKPNFVVRL